MNDIDPIAGNLEAWDEVAPRHAKHNQQRLLDSFKDPDFTLLVPREIEWLQALGVAGKDVAQICCNNGRELICVQRLGAARCVGFDGSAGFAEQGRELAAAAGADVEFVVGDIHKADAAFNSAFDLATITIGVLSWMPSMPDFFATVARLLKPGGAVYIYEQHPVAEMFKVGEAGDPVEFELSYFEKAPYVETDGLDYYGFERYDAKPATSFMHPTSEVITAGIGNGLQVERFEEFPDHISNSWYNLEAAELGVPMSYMMVMRKAS